MTFKEQGARFRGIMPGAQSEVKTGNDPRKTTRNARKTENLRTRKLTPKTKSTPITGKTMVESRQVFR